MFVAWFRRIRSASRRLRAGARRRHGRPTKRILVLANSFSGPRGGDRKPPGTPAQWAEQSWRLAKEALVAAGTNIDEGYFRRHIAVIDDRLALGGVRLAAVLNRALTTAPER